jgi:TonB family protein
MSGLNDSIETIDNLDNNRSLCYFGDRRINGNMSRSITVFIGILLFLPLLTGCSLLFRSEPDKYERDRKIRENSAKINAEYAQIKKRKKGFTTEQPNPPDTILPGPVDYDNLELEFDRMAEMVYEHVPEYPLSAKYSGQTGEVWVKALVDDSGKVRYAEVHKSSGHSLFDRSAVIAAYNNKYKPAIMNDLPVAVWVTYKVVFSLSH